MIKSFKDKKGLLFVTCNECERGGNGLDKDKCACGGSVKRFNGSGCFNGKLMSKYLKQLKQ